MTDETTFIRPEYRRTSAGHAPVDGVQFHSYSVGILRYARISEDGQIITRETSTRATTYTASVIGHGVIRNKTGNVKRFITQDAAAHAGVALWRKLQVKP